MTYSQSLLKRKIEAVIIYPIVLLGKILSPFFPLKSKHGLFIFSPSADIGGSIKVNIDLCECFARYHPLVIFSKKPKNNEFLSQFNIGGVSTIDLHKKIDNKLFHFVNIFYRGVISSWINKQENAVMIGGESLYFYKVLPYVNKKVKRVEISHLNTWLNYNQAFVEDIDLRIFSTQKIKRDATQLYERNSLPQHFFSRLIFIDNSVPIPPLVESNNSVLSVVFIGRGAPQKRVHLIAAIAKEIHELKLNIHISFVGDVEKIIELNDYPYCTFYGNVKDKNKMNSIYESSDVLLLTSAYEGLPIAVMEMMAYGKVIVSTAVDGIPDYITNGVNGFLLENHADENKIVENAVSILQNIEMDRALLKEAGKHSREYAIQHFNKDVFCKNYTSVLFGE
ncbi:MAG: glycosyltransferase family 4 protein [Ginsengibacter sp.]